MTPDKGKIKKIVFELLAERGPANTVCPSEVARHFAVENWRELMPVIHNVIREMQEKNEVTLTQQGHERDFNDIKGPYRIKR